MLYRWVFIFFFIVLLFLSIYFLILPNYTNLVKIPLYMSHGGSIFSEYELPAAKLDISSEHCEGFARLKTILLAINFNFPHYAAVPMLRNFYEPIFGKVIFCGEKEDKTLGVIKIAENKGYQGYECVTTAIKIFPQFNGYIHSNDDVIINWWNFLKLDINKLWLGNKLAFATARKFGDPIDKSWYWWSVEDTAHICEVAFNKVTSLVNTEQGIAVDLQRHLEQYYKNTNDRKLCVNNNWCDFFYLPRQYVPIYVYIASIYSSLKVFLEVAVPTIFTFFVNDTNHHVLNGMYYSNIYGNQPKYYSGEAFYETYSLNLNFSHPFKLEGKMKVANRKFFTEVIMRHGKVVRRFCSFLTKLRASTEIISSNRNKSVISL